MDIINENKENINNQLFKEYFDYSNLDTTIRRLKDAGDEKNKKYGEINQQKPKQNEKKSLKIRLKIKHLRLKRIKK